ncbi:hypothetical protein R1flu_028561 [Riccia fluitans]|uniref:Uncharacterized protein n=1 Tax=Riccia fluitans TaxID=41844 RepID=A0ABD1XR37_9MARC
MRIERTLHCSFTRYLSPSSQTCTTYYPKKINSLTGQTFNCNPRTELFPAQVCSFLIGSARGQLWSFTIQSFEQVIGVGLTGSASDPGASGTTMDAEDCLLVRY